MDADAKKRITVIGGGGAGHTIAADLGLAGFEVTLFEQPRYRETLEGASRCGGVTIRGQSRQGFAAIQRITVEIEEALKGADIIFWAVVASRHQEIAEICAPHLKDGQTFVISPGNAGSLIFADVLKKKGIKRQVNVAELEGSLYSCRLVGAAEVVVALPYKPKYLSAFPAKNTEKVVGELKGIYEVFPATNVLETTLNTPNLVTHLAASLLNAGAIEKSEGEYYLYKQGLAPSVLACIEAVHQERTVLLKILGYANRYSMEFLRRVACQTKYQELDTFRNLIGPTSLQHRYITEDASTGVCLMVSLGRMVGVPTPVSAALVTLASAINRVDYLKEGRSVEKLGVAGLGVEELNRYLAQGIA